MDTIKNFRTIYNNKNDIEKDLKRIQIILNSKSFFESNLYIDEDMYMNYYKKLNLLKYFINKLYFQEILEENQEIDQWIKDINFKKIKDEAQVFCDELYLIEKKYISKIRKFSFTRENLYVWDHLKKIKDFNENEDLWNEITSDIKFLEENITQKDFLMLKMYLKKLDSLAKIEKSESYIQLNLVECNLIDSFRSNEFSNNLIKTLEKSQMYFEQVDERIQKFELSSDFDYEFQIFSLENTFKLLSENYLETFLIIKEQIVQTNKSKTSLLSDPKIDSIILYNNDNSFIQFTKLLRYVSQEIHLKYVKFFNHYEFSQLNYCEEDINYWFLIHIVKELLIQIVNDEQKLSIKKHVNSIIYQTLKKSASECLKVLKLSHDLSNNEIEYIEDMFNFNDIFFDANNFDATQTSSLFKTNKHFKKLIGICAGFYMFEKLEYDDKYLEKIEMYYKKGTNNTTYDNLKILGINLLDYDFISKTINSLCERLNNETKN